MPPLYRGFLLPINKFLNMPMFIGSQSFISLPCFMFVSAVVSEIRKLKEKKEKNSEIDYFQFNTFPGHLIYPFFKPELPF